MRKNLVLLQGQELYDAMLEQANLMYSDYNLNNTAQATVQWNEAQMLEQAKYAVGIQEQIRYKLSPETQKEGGSNPALIITSETRNLQFVNKLLTAGMGVLEKQEYEPQVNRIDQSAKKFRQEYRKDLEFAVMLNQLNVAYDGMAKELQIDPSALPERTDDLDAYMDSDVQLEEEINMEYALRQSSERYNFPSITRQNRLHTFVHAVAGTRIDNSGPKLVVRAVYPARVRTSFSNLEDLSDISYFRERILVPLTWLRTYYSDYFTKDQWDEILAVARPYEQHIGFGIYSSSSYGSFEGDLFVEVLDAVWKEGNKYNNKIKETPGGLRTYQDINGSKGTYKSEPIECVMGLKRIIGTDLLYDYGRQIPEYRCPRTHDTDDLEENDWRPVELPVVLCRTMPLYGVSVSSVDKVMSIIDGLQNLANKYNNLAKKVKPGVTVFQLSRLADLTSNGSIRDPDVVKRILINYEIKGDIFIADDPDALPGQNQKAVESFADQTATQLPIIWNEIINHMNLAREYFGIPQIVDGITKDREGKGVTEISLSNVEAGLSGISGCVKSIYERTNKQLCLLYQYTGTKGMHKNRPYKIDPKEAANWIFNITCKMKATAEDWADVKAAAYQAWADGNGWLSYADLIYITDNPSLKEANKRFSYLDKQFKKQQAQLAQANTEMADQSAAKAIELQKQSKNAQIEAKGNEELKKQTEIGQQKLEQIQTQSTEDMKAMMKEFANELIMQVKEAQKEVHITELQTQSAEEIAEMKPETTSA